MDSLADREWRLIGEEPATGRRTWRSTRSPRGPPSRMASGPFASTSGRRVVSPLGYRQAAESVDWAYCEREGIDVTRRQTGGGGIYHDRHADVSYSIIAPAAELPGDLMDCYELLCEPVLDAIRSVGVNADFAAGSIPRIHQPACYLREIHPAHDVLAYESEDSGGERVGRKLSGNAQYRQRDAVIQHGSVSFDHAIEHHLGVFADHDVTPERFRERVTSVREQAGVDRETFVDALEGHLGEWCDADPGAGATTNSPPRATSWTRSTTTTRGCANASNRPNAKGVSGRQRVVFGS